MVNLATSPLNSIAKSLDFLMGCLFLSQVTSGLGLPATLHVTVIRSPSTPTFKNKVD